MVKTTAATTAFRSATFLLMMFASHGGIRCDLNAVPAACVTFMHTLPRAAARGACDCAAQTPARKNAPAFPPRRFRLPDLTLNQAARLLVPIRIVRSAIEAIWDAIMVPVAPTAVAIVPPGGTIAVAVHAAEFAV